MRAQDLVDPRGAALRSGRCPGCGAGKDQRVDSAGFGPMRAIVCGSCGHEFPEDRAGE